MGNYFFTDIFLTLQTEIGNRLSPEKLNINFTAMKHISLFSAALTLAASVFSLEAAYADETTPYIEFSYAGNPYGAGGYSESSYKGGAMLLTEEVVARFDGCRITEVMIANGEFHDQAKAPVEVFFTKDLTMPSFYRFNGQMDIDRPKEYKTYPLSQAVEIHIGEPFFVGFVTWASGVSAPNYEVSYPVWTDGVLHTDLPGGYIGFSETTGSPEKMEWNDEGYSGGQVCMRLKIEGDNLPKNVAELSEIRMNDYVNPLSVADAFLTVCNKGVNPITDLDLSYTVFDKTESIHFDFPQGVGYDQSVDMGIGVAVPQEGVNIPVSFYIEKVNGSAPSSNATTTSSVTVHSILPENGFEHKMVVEEAGGSGCGWCPRGIVGLDQMFKNHGHEAFIPISAHHIGYGEETAPFGYDALWERYITHNPSCLVNRNIRRYGITDPNTDNLEWIYNEVSESRAIADIHITGCHEENGWLSVDSEVSFAFSEEEGAYSVAYVVTEDGVGPYMQSNSYSGAEYEMGGWESLPSVVPTYYDFLARGISSFDGTPLNPLLGIDAGRVYTHSDKVYLVKVRDMSRIAVIAMLINDKNGMIENADRIPIADLNTVESVSSGNSHAEYYDLSGRRISGRPTSGIYIERQGGNARKVIATP